MARRLVAQARSFVADGWVADFNKLLAESLRRFMEPHSSRLTETFVMEDVNWGLQGND